MTKNTIACQAKQRGLYIYICTEMHIYNIYNMNIYIYTYECRYRYIYVIYKKRFTKINTNKL